MAITINGSPSGTEVITGEPTSIFLPGGGLSVRGNFPTVAFPATSGALKVITSPFILPNAVSTPAVYAISSYSTFTPSGAIGGQSTTGYHVSFTKNANPSGASGTPTGTLFTNDFSFGSQEVGSITASGSGNFTSYTTTSDHRLKENVTPVENGLDYIMPLRPRKYTWKNTGYEGVGFIAHELEEDFPPHLNNIVNGEKDKVEITVNIYKDGVILTNESDGSPIKRLIPIGVEAERLMSEGYTWVTVEENPLYQSIDTVGLISPLVSSIQQLKKIYDVQQVKINKLKVRVLEMEKN